MNAEIIIAVIILIVGLILSGVAISTMRKGTFVSREVQLGNEVKQLRAILDILNQDRLRDTERIRKLEYDLSEANQRIRELELHLKKYENDDTIGNRLERALLVGIGSDSSLQVDLAALRAVKTKTGLGFSRILPITFEKFHHIIADARMRGKPYRYIHLAVHANATGVKFERTISPLELSSELQDVKVLVIAGCESNEVGMLLGVVPYVISMRETVTHDDAMRFTEAFWINIGNGSDPEDAFYDAIAKVPNVGEFAEIHC